MLRIDSRDGGNLTEGVVFQHLTLKYGKEFA